MPRRRSPRPAAQIPPAHPKSDVPYAPLIVAAAKTHGIDPALLAALIHQESGFD